MTEVLKDIDYKKVFHFFEEISNVPRGSKDNKAISDYLYSFAKERNLEVTQDDLLNVVIIKEATKGYENCPAVMLQGHMDMVCIKEPTSTHDFKKEGLEIFVDGDFIKAKGTTLGGDNGIAIAYALAILDSDEFIHPRLEVVVTTDEEIGLIGATGLDTSNLQAKYMLNLDSEEESSILVGCAGGLTAVNELPLERESVTKKEMKISVLGLQGGHSGVEIDKNRTNAVHLAARLLMELKEQVEFSIVSMTGGQKDNAIPSECFITVAVSEENVQAMRDKIEECQNVYKHELQASEPGVHLGVEEGSVKECAALTKESMEKLMIFIQYQPNGIQKMSSNIKGLVESSLNLGVLKMNETNATIKYSVRSSFATYKEYLSKKLEQLTNMLGGTFKVEGSYPAWEFNPESKLRDLMVEIYKEEFKREPIIEAIHAGLECGIISEKMPGLDIVSIGPDMKDVHTPKEQLSISSTIRVFDFVTKTLEAICKQSA